MIFVVKLPSRITETDLKYYVEKFGYVNEVTLLKESSIINDIFW